MPEMWPTLIPRPEETLRCMRLRGDHKASTLLMAKQEDQPDTDSLEASSLSYPTLVYTSPFSART